MGTAHFTRSAPGSNGNGNNRTAQALAHADANSTAAAVAGFDEHRVIETEAQSEADWPAVKTKGKENGHNGRIDSAAQSPSAELNWGWRDLEQPSGFRTPVVKRVLVAVACAMVLFGSIDTAARLYSKKTMAAPTALKPVSSLVADTQPAPPSPADIPPGAAVHPEQTRTIQGLEVVRDQNRVAVAVTTDGHVVPIVTKLMSPDRLVLDLVGTRIATGPQRILVNSGGVKTVRVSSNGLNPPTARVVVDLAKPCEYGLLSSNNKLTLQLRPIVP